MYNTGTVTTTANSTKVTGTNTKWKDNNSLVSAEQVILIQNGTTVYINSIASIQSDTELTLSFAAPAAVKNGSYRILTTMVNSISDAANKLVAMNNANAVFSEVLNRMFTETGIITVVLPDGTILKTKTFAEMDKQLDGKFDKTGGPVEGGLSATGAIQTSGGQVTAHTAGGVGAQLDSRGYIAKIRSRNKNGTWFDHAIPETAGTFMQVGDLGFGAGRKSNATDTVTIKNFNDADRTAVYKSDDLTENARFTYSPMLNMTRRGGSDGTGFCGQIQVDSFTGILSSRGGTSGGRWSGWMNAYSPANTTKDSNGNLKAASPVIKVFADHIELNDESEGVELEKLDTGRYKLKGTLGMHSDASWGGIHGGLVVPNGINNLPLVWADFDVLPDGDIVIETRYRKHALHQMLEAQRLMSYPEFLDENNEEREDYDYCDIPNGHWIDVRVQMPSNSIYNQKQAEAERLAKLEAERLAQEEETERAEQEGQNEA